VGKGPWPRHRQFLVLPRDCYLNPSEFRDIKSYTAPTNVESSSFVTRWSEDGRAKLSPRSEQREVTSTGDHSLTSSIPVHNSYLTSYSEYSVIGLDVPSMNYSSFDATFHTSLGTPTFVVIATSNSACHVCLAYWLTSDNGVANRRLCERLSIQVMGVGPRTREGAEVFLVTSTSHSFS
jgi:hypothetical protein